MDAQLYVPASDESGSIVKTRFINFLQTFTAGRGTNDEADDEANINNADQVLLTDYVGQLQYMMQNNKSTLYVDFQHVLQIDYELAEAIELEYYRFEPFLRAALQDIVSVDNQRYVFDMDKGQRHLFVAFYNTSRCDKIRSAMRTEKIGRLIALAGTVTRSSDVRPELLYGSFTCIRCGTVHTSVDQQYVYTEPHVCRNMDCSNRGKGHFNRNTDQCSFVDWQRLRVQENSEEIPAGSMPRCIDVICRNEIVEMAKAGDRITFTGCLAVIPSSSGLSKSGESASVSRGQGRNDQSGSGVGGLKKFGVQELTYKMVFIACSIQHVDQRTSGRQLDHQITFSELTAGANDKDGALQSGLTPAEEAEIQAIRDTPHLYTKMVESVCPSVFGHHEVKRGVLLMLFGGVHKVTHEGLSKRGDINICIVGDPSCAKSQFLKYVHGFLPRTVYTSGKSSSAAGLTASVVRDSETGEFCVEAGALMLADNGICCIDEFDKMDLTDQVAIHEAMEQQTISITKAGIQATLNARTSILAAANPVFGRYDRTKTLKANVAMGAPIMSRFDLFFVIIDECNPVIDESIARHIIRVHKQGGGQQVNEEVPFTAQQLQKYIKYARTLNPAISQESKKELVACYRLLRQNDILGKNRTSYRITVRQLESLIRLSEALARLHLSNTVQPPYVKEAYRLLQKSIIFVETEDIDLEANEEEMNAMAKNNRSHFIYGDGDGDDGDNGDDDDGNGDDKDGEGGGDDAAGRGERGKDRGREDDDGISSAQPSPKKARVDSAIDGDGEGREKVKVKRERGGGGKKMKVQITAKEYDEISQLLQIGLKQLQGAQVALAETQPETQSDSATAPAEVSGVLWKDLAQWYLTQLQGDLTSEDIFDQKRKLVNLVIRRMIKHEGSIIELQQEGGGEGGEGSGEDRRLQLHPSFDV